MNVKRRLETINTKNTNGGYLLTFLIVGLLIIVPLFLMIFTSFRTESPSVPSELTVDPYRNVLFSSWFPEVVFNTFIVAVGSTLIGLGLGTLLAWITIRTNTPFRKKLQAPIILPFFIAPFIGGIAWGLLGDRNIGLLNRPFEYLFGISPIDVYSAWGIVFVMGLYFVPFAFLLVYGPLSNIDTSLEEASRVCGAGKFKTISKVTIPLVTPSMLSAAVLIFVASAGQFGIPATLGMQDGFYVISTRIYIETSSLPVNFNAAAVLGSVLVVVISLLVVLRSKFISDKSFTTVSGGTRSELIDLGHWRWITFGIAVSYILLAVVLPLGIIALASVLQFWDARPRLSLLTMDHWRFMLYEYPITYRATINSLLIATVGSAVAMVLASAVSWYTVRRSMIGGHILDTAATLPIAIPGLVMGLAYIFLGLRFFTVIYGTIAILGMAYIARFVPYGVRTVAGALQQINPKLEEAGRTSGASQLRAYKDITFPLITPSILSGYVLLFVIFVRELGVSILLYGPGSEVFSVAIFDLWTDGNFPELSVLAVIQLSVTVVALAILSWIGTGGLFSTVQKSK